MTLTGQMKMGLGCQGHGALRVCLQKHKQYTGLFSQNDTMIDMQFSHRLGAPAAKAVWNKLQRLVAATHSFQLHLLRAHSPDQTWVRENAQACRLTRWVDITTGLHLSRTEVLRRLSTFWEGPEQLVTALTAPLREEWSVFVCLQRHEDWNEPQ